MRSVGSISLRVSRGGWSTGLISIAVWDGTFATGVDGISFDGRKLYGIENVNSAIVPPSGFPAWILKKARNQLGRLIVADGDGHWKAVANVGLRDFIWTGQHKNLVPGQFPDANPYGVLALPGKRWVVDAGSNTLDRVSADGDVRVVKFIPNPPSSDAVPTCVARGRDGALYSASRPAAATLRARRWCGATRPPRAS